MKRYYIALLVLCPLVLGLTAAIPALGQEFRSTLTGRVTDPSGAPVPAARLMVNNTSTNSRVRTVSGPDGFYTVPFLPPGPYQITVTVPGFKEYIHSGIHIGTNEQVTENVQLAIGNTRQTVVVTSNLDLVNTASASMAENITSREVADLPLNGRNPLALVRYAYGVVPKQKHLLNEVKPFDTSSGVDVALGGANSGSNEYLLNGVPDMSSGARQGGFAPPMDSVDEVKVQLFQADASVGHTLGGTVDMVTKSGTNQFHGTLYEYNETSALAANPFFLNAHGQSQSVTRQNQYGGSLGGPVFLPKVLNGHNKLFFFFAYEGFKDSAPGVFTGSVPTSAERNGDFSALLAAGGKSYQLYNPATGVLNSQGQVVRQPFTNNVITSPLNPIALKYLSFFPQPNAAGTSVGENNYVVNNPQFDNYGAYVGRLDFNLSDRNKLYFEVNQSSYSRSSNDVLQNIASGQFAGFGMWQGTLDDVQTISPTFMWDNRIGFMRNVATSSIKSDGFNPTQLGFPGYIAQNSALLAMPRIGFTDNYVGFSTTPGSTQPFTTLEGFTAGTKVLNRHTLEFGMDFQAQQESFLNPGYSSGNYNFGDNWLRASTTASGIPFGGSLASFLLGLPTGGEFDVNTNFTDQNYYYAWFLQDNWHARSNLTIDAGVRFEHETPLSERYGRETVGFNEAAVNQVTTAAEAAYAANPPKLSGSTIQPLSPSAFQPTGGLVYASSPHQSGYTEPGVFVSPRLGIAWAPKRLSSHGTTAIRAGFGVFDNPFGASPYITGPTYGFSQATPFVATQNNYLSEFTTLSDPFPGGSILKPVGSALGVNQNLGQGVSFYSPHFKLPYSMRWTFDIQHQFTRNLMLDVGYVGNRQIDGTMSVSLGALPLQYLSTAPARDQTVINELGASVTNPFTGLLPGTGLNGPKTSLANLLHPYPEFSGVTLSDIAGGYSNFNMLAVRLEKRFSSGLQFNFDYNYSRQLATSPLNAGQLSNFWYGVTASDYPQRYVFSGIYQLPFGRGRHFMSGASRPVDLALGGWNLSTIFTWESGPPLSWGNDIYLGGSLNMHPRGLTQAFDTTQFDTNSKDQLADNYRTFGPMYNYWRADNANNTDITLLKDFHLTERVALQYRIDAFNAFNRAQFASPNLSPTSKAFGTITGQANTPRAIQMALQLTF